MSKSYELFIRSDDSTETIANLIAPFLGGRETMPRVENDPFVTFGTDLWE